MRYPVHRGLKPPAFLVMALLLASLTVPLVYGQAAAGAVASLGWLRPGVQASYEIAVVSGRVNPNSPGVKIIEEGNLDKESWISVISVIIPSEAVTYGVLELYSIKTVDAGRGTVSYDKLSVRLVNSDVKSDKSEGVAPLRSGPFWLDPGKLINLRVGDVLRIRDGKGQVLEFRVIRCGPLRVSGLGSGENSLAGLVGAQYSLPVPEDTVRETVMLAAKPSPRELLVIVADTRLGIIYYYGYVVKENAKGGDRATVITKALSGINIDIENRLPSYNDKRYDYGSLLRTGYVFSASWIYADPTFTSIATMQSMITGFYKNYVTVTEFVFASINMATGAYYYTWLVDLDSHTARLVKKQDMLGTGVEPLTPRGAPLLLAPLASRGEVIAYNVRYIPQGNGIYRAAEAPANSLYFATLRYNQQGLLTGAEAAVANMPLDMQAKIVTANELQRVYYSYPYPAGAGETHAGVDAGKVGEQEDANGQPQLPAINISIGKSENTNSHGGTPPAPNATPAATSSSKTPPAATTTTSATTSHATKPSATPVATGHGAAGETTRSPSGGISIDRDMAASLVLSTAIILAAILYTRTRRP